MPANEIEMTIPVNTVRNTDTEVVVKAAGRKLGSLHLSQDAIVWNPATRSESVSFTWERFSKLMADARPEVAESPRTASRRVAAAPRATAPTKVTASAARGKATAPKRRGRAAAKVATKSAAPGRRGGVDASVVREWANANGIDVSARGRLRSAVVAAYHAAN